MKQQELKEALIHSLSKLYEMKAFAILAQFLQGETQVLFFLSQHWGREINPSDLSDSLHVSRSRITATLTALRKKGYVSMELSQEDRRRMSITLTDAGRSHIREKQKQVNAYFDQLVEGLGEETTVTLNQIIDQSIRIISTEPKKG